VCRVGDHDIRFGDFRHHAAACYLTLHIADAPLDLRITLIFLGFLAQIFPGHAQLACVIPDLERHIDDDDQQHGTDDQHKSQADQSAHADQAGIQRHANQIEYILLVTPDNPGSNTTNDHHLGNGLD